MIIEDKVKASELWLWCLLYQVSTKHIYDVAETHTAYLVLEINQRLFRPLYVLLTENYKVLIMVRLDTIMINYSFRSTLTLSTRL